MKKLITIIMALALVAAVAVGMVACKNTSDADVKDLNMNGVKTTTTVDGESVGTPIAASAIKVGLITLHGTESTYDKNFIDAFYSATAALGIPDANVIVRSNIGETDACYQTASDLVDQGCNIIFADSFGHESYMLQAAQEFPNVQFCHATGTKAHTAGVANYHNAFASIYEGRYLAGVAAGLKLNEMITAGTITAAQAKMGYVGAWPYAEVKSGYTSFYLGAKSVCPSVTMDVKFTNSWYDETAENETAQALIAGGCKLISQHADSYGAPSACEAAGVPNVSYNGSTAARCPNTFIVSSRINWAPYYTYAISSVIAGKAIASDWCGTIASGSVELTDFGTVAPAANTATKVAEVKANILNGTVKVFDTANFTKGGVTLTEYVADVDDFGDFKGETNVIVDGVFYESVGRSAPYFDIDIDGITIK